jgi:pyruvate dehydrogenase E2 component (dihydrolipoamide acetyltransferase)
MVASHQTTAPVTLTTTADATQLVHLRERFKTENKSPEVLVPSVTDIFVKVTAVALQSFPLLNARWQDNEMVIPSEIHIGIAVDTDSGLVVPVIRNTDRQSLLQIAERTRELIGKARSRQLTPDDMRGGTFTVTNLGPYGIDAFTPIIQLPQCAILGIGRLQKMPVFVDGRFEPRDMIALSLTFDHRIVDGGPAARYLQAIVKAIAGVAKESTKP